MARYGKATLSIRGLKELKDTLGTMSSEIDGQRLYDVMGDAVQPMKAAARRNIMTISVAVGMSINVASKQPPSRPRKKTVLVVVHKQDTIREWVAANFNRSPRAKVGPGGKVAESLGTMLEEGTTRTWRNGPGVEAHHWFKNAVDSTKGEVRSNLVAGLNGIIEEVVAKRQIPA